MAVDAIHIHTGYHKSEISFQKRMASTVELIHDTTTGLLHPCNETPVAGGHGQRQADEHMSSSIKDYRGATPAERKRIKAAVLSEYRGRVGALVRRRLSSDHWEEAEQVGLIGVLVALDRYEPEKNDAFWPYAALWVWREIQRWLDHAVYWRPTTNKARLSRTAIMHRHHASMDAALPGGDTLHDLVVTRAPSAEELLSEAELTARLRRFAATLSADERVTLFAENGGRFPSRQYLTLVERATKFVKADPSNAPVIRAKNANSSARARRKRTHKTS